MMVERLRKISKTVLREEGKETGRSFEWGERYNRVSLQLDKLVVLRDFRFYKVSPDPANEKGHEVAPGSSLRIKGIVDREKLRDELHFAENIADGELINPARVRGDISVELISYDPEETDEDEDDEEDRDANVRARRRVSYQGDAFRMDDEDGHERVYISLPMPTRWVSYIARALEKDGRSIVGLQVDLASFTSEVEDALREHWHPLELVVLDGAPAFAVHLNIETPLSDRVPVAEETSVERKQLDEEENDARTDELVMERERARLFELVRSTMDPIRGLSGVVLILAIVLAADIAVRAFGL